MSKQKVVSSLLLSTVVLGGLAFYSTTTVKAESLEPDVTSVNASDATNKPVVSNEEESDFLAEEEELEESDAPVETLNEEIKDVTEPSSPEALLQPRAMMSNSGSNDTEEIPVDDSVSVSEKIAETPLIQTTNADSTNYKNSVEQEKFQKSVTIDSLKLEKDQITWRVTFDTSEWSFNQRRGGLYFILPKGLKLTSIKDDAKTELFERFPKTVENSKNNSNDTYRFFSQEETGSGDKDFNQQWGWSAGQANPNDMIKGWKEENRFSKIYFIDNISTTTQLAYTLTASITYPNQKSFPVAAVMKTFGYKNWSGTEVTSLGAREITLETPKETPMPPKEAPKTEPEAPKPDSGIILKPLPKPEVPQTPPAPSTPEKQPEVPEAPKQDTPEAPKEDPKKEDAPQTPPAPPAPSVPEEPQTPPAPEAPTEEPKETPKPEMPEAPQVPEEQPKETPEASPQPEAPSTPEKQPEAPKKEDAPAPEVPQTPTPESPQPEAPKETPEASPKPEVPQTPQVPSTPKEEAPKEEVPAPEVPSVPEEQPKETPTPEVPKQEDVQPEAPKSDKVETDKPMPETKQPDMKQPKTDDMPKEQKPKADEPK
ncbi:TPA: cell surface protein, partial [Streptococcus suis]|nr:cell surface protein [Streptococcus suis]